MAQSAPSVDVEHQPDGRTQDAAMVEMVDGMTTTEAVSIMPMADLPPEIVVTGVRLRRRTNETASGNVLSGVQLETRLSATIGETLAHLPGASSTSFGPSAARPVLRGFTGERARVVIDGIGTLDASTTSPDHAVALNPLVADRIELLRGPVSILYAAGSLGGVVNSVSGRIPRRRPPDGVAGVARAGFDSAAIDGSIGARIDVASGPHMVLHADGQYLIGDDVTTGGFIVAPGPRADAAASADPAIRRLAGLQGRLPNSGFETWEAAAGASLVYDNGHIGLSFANYESVYGLPTRFSFDPATPVPDTRIDLDQQRLDFRLEFDTGGVIDTVRARFGWADYVHHEVNVGGPITANFLNTAYEARLEAVVGGTSQLKATLGAQLYQRDFTVTGPAPLLPPTRTTQLSLFTLGEIDLAPLRLEAAVRYEHVAIRSSVDPILFNPAIDRSFDPVSIAAGANYSLSRDWKVALNAFYQQRAPVVEELFTQGIDPGTQGQLIGNPALGLERSWGVEAILRGGGPGWSASATGYYTRYPNIIFARENGASRDGLPVFLFLESGAAYYGYEIQGNIEVGQAGDWKIAADALIDYAHATLTGGAPVPRIPPLRLLAGADVGGDRLTSRAEIEWITPQSRVSAFETPTRGFVTVNLQFGWKPLGAKGLQLRLIANNLFGSEGRRHASLLKDFAPLPGRDIRLNAKMSF
ncbi:MAG: hypothetical protein B7Y45_06625 [Sphingomonas sp. 28-66-16]|nr:MAG: hypothetical protein B7Y45_06625 [Sphingomonas sp. 28-66-16]